MAHVADQSVLASIVAPSRLDGYERHRPEDTVLYQTTLTHWPGFKSRMEEQGGLPKFVVREFEHYLDCGSLGHGCLRLECRHCAHSELVAFSWPTPTRTEVAEIARRTADRIEKTL